MRFMFAIFAISAFAALQIQYGDAKPVAEDEELETLRELISYFSKREEIDPIGTLNVGPPGGSTGTVTSGVENTGNPETEGVDPPSSNTENGDAEGQPGPNNGNTEGGENKGNPDNGNVGNPSGGTEKGGPEGQPGTNEGNAKGEGDTGKDNGGEVQGGDAGNGKGGPENKDEQINNGGNKSGANNPDGNKNDNANGEEHEQKSGQQKDTSVSGNEEKTPIGEANGDTLITLLSEVWDTVSDRLKEANGALADSVNNINLANELIRSLQEDLEKNGLDDQTLGSLLDDVEMRLEKTGEDVQKLADELLFNRNHEKEETSTETGDGEGNVGSEVKVNGGDLEGNGKSEGAEGKIVGEGDNGGSKIEESTGGGAEGESKGGNAGSSEGEGKEVGKEGGNGGGKEGGDGGEAVSGGNGGSKQGGEGGEAVSGGKGGGGGSEGNAGDEGVDNGGPEVRNSGFARRKNILRKLEMLRMLQKLEELKA